MLKNLLPFFLLILFFFINPLSSKNLNAQESPKIKVLTFNKGPWYFAENDQRPKKLAEFVKNENIEIVAIQEGRYESEIKSEGLLLKNAFEEIDYKMYMVQVKETKHEANIILSKYPFIENTYSETEMRERNRIIQRVAINTPYGKLWITNIHTHYKAPCDNALKIFNHALTPTNGYTPNINNIILGDFNLYLKNNKPELTGCSDGNLTATQNLLLNFRASCTTSICSNINKGYIDWIITTKTSPIELVSTWQNDTIKPLGDGHPPIIGIIQSNTFVQKGYYDFNNDGILNIKDILDFAKYVINTQNKNIKYDYNNDGKVDIKDIIKMAKSTIG